MSAEAARAEAAYMCAAAACIRTEAACMHAKAGCPFCAYQPADMSHIYMPWSQTSQLVHGRSYPDGPPSWGGAALDGSRRTMNTAGVRWACCRGSLHASAPIYIQAARLP
jgi:hypothetical protein